MQRTTSILAWLAAAVALGGAIGFGLALDGYSHAVHPLGLLGARDLPHARAFNLVGFVMPGLLLAGAGLGLRARLDAAGWPLRIGATLAVLSALAYAAQGAFPLDPEHLDSGDSRYHAAAWTLWWVSFVPGAALLASDARTRWLHVAAAVAVPVLALVVPGFIGPALAQRLAFVAWFGWWLLALRRPR